MAGPSVVIGVATEAAYRARVSAIARARQTAVAVSGASLVAYVNEGRWVADCPCCHAGISIHPRWSFAACLGCCTTFTAIAIPDEWEAGEVALCARPATRQHWRPGETREMLQAETVAQGGV